MTTKFEKIIDNPRIFKIILDEFFRGWPGSYDIMPVENHAERFFENHEKFAAFCRKVRTKEKGNNLCMGCDIKYSRKAKDQGEPKYYMCHAGLMDIAVPIIVGDELIATIFCGQSRPADQKLEKKALERSIRTEKKLGFEKGELLELRKQTPVISLEQVKGLQSRLWEVATYVSQLGSNKLEAEKTKRDLAYRLLETESIQKILLELSGELYDVETFWKMLDNALDKICEIIEASFSLFIICTKDIIEDGIRGQIKSASATPRLAGNLSYLTCSPSVSRAINEMLPIIINANEERVFSDYLEKLELQTSENDQIDKIAIIPVRLDPENIGAMILFSSQRKDVNKSLELKDEISILTQAGERIATAYGNSLLYQQQKELAEVQSDWLENVSHQILAPINEILGQTENLSRSFRTWQKSSPYRIDSTLITLVELSDWATRLARNFAWVARKPMQPRDLNLRLEDDVAGKMIGYARNVQGLAKTRGIYWVHVVSESVAQLNGRIIVDNKLFKQAVTNLLDNAVKYALPKTEVSITAEMSAAFGQIHITDYGIRLHKDEAEKIFTRYYRTNEAKKKYSVGSGIGLGIAREIIRLHGGDLTVQPSELSNVGWKTTFLITLPLTKESGNA